MMLRRALLVSATICGLLVASAAPAQASVTGWKITRGPATAVCGTTVVSSYANNTQGPVEYTRTTTTTSKVTVSASISGGAGAIEAEIGYSNEQSVALSEQISLTIPARTVLNLRVRYTQTPWTLSYSGWFGTTHGTGVSRVPVGLCISTTTGPTPPPP
ncbi:hypothetical protein [Polymorphospora rubra]|uniref:Uncharacterized protein n=1 Tax=Polymorphospora rubra TaxID=338584 RepID=A0A810N9P1_9ACTN|nr:hypothetical protein [Polymorphospora rubra]BCJ69780.1 hypothetical protein Prubr_68010 [Polymorphospora rubra]